MTLGKYQPLEITLQSIENPKRTNQFAIVHPRVTCTGVQCFLQSSITPKVVRSLNLHGSGAFGPVVPIAQLDSSHTAVSVQASDPQIFFIL
ncbi:hypothetical protein Poly51_14640 [Rubripirellula tenax]|uniref:Uncharacterized protein n=1 Tax=Rubripirellula tenax TaxID=2528015 RepID=A0A5C6FB78_9BACT|nr:hypothetical protein Poly51_14640 [Rubripirellula tenax]